ncbi:MAG: hypothetical protein LBJ44_05125 [Propionibacteriaceae bacterium]|jgi:tetratricopeptide (TPR) repeat protein|nr:hypothetical protein [Propionibacteriaceae bacterium]
MSRSVVEANAAIGRIRAMPYGRARSEAAEREARRIESEGPDEARAYALTALVEALTWGDEYEKAFLPFTRLLRWWDAHPEQFDRYDQSVMFWEFGWIMSDLPQIPTVSRVQVEATLDDMERRFALANRGMERVWSSRLDWALLRGGDDVDQIFTTWLTMPPDEDDSCDACHEALHAEYLAWRGQLEPSIAILETAVASDRNCSREPAAMLTDLALAYLDQGRWQATEEILPKALAELKKAVSTSLSSAYARVFEIYGRAHRPDLALELLAERQKDLDTGTPYRRLNVSRRIVSGCAALMAVGLGSEPVALTGLAVSDVAQLHDWALAQAEDLTAQFDRRNGTTEQSQRLAAARLARPTPDRLEFRGLAQAVAEISAAAERAALDSSDEPGDNAQSIVSAADRPGQPPVGPDRRQAELAWSEERWADAAAAFQRAAELAQADGLLRLSGWDWAEAARCLRQADQPEAASLAYRQALSRLRAGDAPVEELSQVLVAWAPTVGPDGWADFVEETNTARGQLPPLVSEREDGPELDDVAGFGLTFKPIRRQLKARADLDDALARVLASWGGPDQRLTAIERARSATEVYRSVGATLDAAHTDWLLGRLTEAEGWDDQAEQGYKAALEGFKTGGQRQAEFCHRVATSWAELCQRSGHPERAQAILSADPHVDPEASDQED